jgi:hypothetical protein
MTPSPRNLLLIAILVAALSRSASAGDLPPKLENCITVELEDGNATAVRAKNNPNDQVLDKAAVERFRQWRFEPDNVRRLKIPMIYRYIPPAVPSGPTVI